MNININIELLKTFYVVAKYKNITKASNELLVSQSTVSKSIKNIEEQLDCQLFTRSKKGVDLTKEGEILYNSAEKVLNILNTDLKKITKTKTINILVGKILADKVLVPYIYLFQKKYPNIKINLSCTDLNGVKSKLKNDEIDLALGYYIEDLEETYEQRKISQKLHPIFVCSKDYKELINKTINIKELEKYPFIISSKGATTHNYTLNIFKENNLDIIPTMEILGTSLVTQLVKNSLGISILTKEFIEEELKNQELFEIELEQELEPRYLTIVTYKNKILSKEIQYLIDLLINNIQKKDK